MAQPTPTPQPYSPPTPSPDDDVNEAIEATQGVQEDPDIPAGAAAGVEDESDLDELLRKLGAVGVAQQLGFDVKPTKAQLLDYLDESGYMDLLDNQRARIENMLAGPYAGAAQDPNFMARLQEEFQRERADFWADPDHAQMMAWFQGSLGPEAGKGKRAEVPGDPLTQYFAAWERMGAETLGPAPEATFMNVPGVKAAIEALTPTDFQQYLETQGPALQARYLAQMFEQFGPQLEQYGAELAQLPEYSEETDTYPRFERFLGMREEFGLDFVQPYEEFVGEKIPALQQRYKYLKPLSDEESSAAFRDVFGAAMGEGGGQITPFGTFVSRQQEALQTEFGDLVREQLSGGVELGALPSYEEFLTGQAGELERTFQMTSPYVTGRRTPGRLARPTRKL